MIDTTNESKPFDWDAPAEPNDPDVEKAVSDIAGRIEATGVTQHEAYMLGTLAAHQTFRQRKNDTAWLSGFCDAIEELSREWKATAQKIMTERVEQETHGSNDE